MSKCDRIFGDDGSDTSTDQSPHWREVTNAVFPETLSWRTFPMPPTEPKSLGEFGSEMSYTERPLSSSA